MLAVVAVPVQLVGQLVAGACSPEVDKCILDLESGRWFRIVESESVASKIPPRVSGSTSVEKALRVCEVLSAQPDGQSVTELAESSIFRRQQHTGCWRSYGTEATSGRTTVRRGTD